MHGYLTQIGFDFEEQYSLRNGSILDFIVQLKKPDGTLISIDIETDGSKWHHTTSQRQRDLMRDKNTRSLGIDVLRFREGFNGHMVYGAIQQLARRYGVVNFPKCPESFGD
jgi:very-short-patch-repair endonuclease